MGYSRMKEQIEKTERVDKKIDNEKIKKIKTEGDILGFSVAVIRPNEPVEVEWIGCDRGCAFLKMDVDPIIKDKKDFGRFAFKNTEFQDAIILFNNELYYSDQQNQTVTKIEVTESNQKECDQLRKKCDGPFRLAQSNEEHQLIQKVTGRFPAPEFKKEQEPVFQAASLSKPVFAYLILKLIEKNKSTPENLKIGKFNLPTGVEEFNVDTKLCDVLPELKNYGTHVQKITVGMVLSHSSGLTDFQGSNPQVKSEPGTEYAYTGWHLFYLQMALEKVTGATLEQLAQEHVFVPLRMKQTTFLRPGFSIDSNKPEEEQNKPKEFVNPDLYGSISANSLKTTASDYAKFMIEWMNDEKLTYAFITKSHTTTDKWANLMKIPNEVLKRVDWGLGVGLQKDNDGNKTIGVFHSGDMNEWRAFMAFDPEKKTGVAYFSNSKNGLVLAQELTSGLVNVEDALKYISEKYGFATNDNEDNWKEKQAKQFDKIDICVEELKKQPNLPEPSLVEKKSPETTEVQSTPSGLTETVVFSGGSKEKAKHMKEKLNQMKEVAQGHEPQVQEEARSTITPLRIIPKPEDKN
jgi:CubicO group peptidase (beta-lactamase class C family)